MESTDRTCQLRTPSPQGFQGRSPWLYLDHRKNVIDIIVRGERNLVQSARRNALDDFIAGEIEDRLQNLLPLLQVRLSHQKQHASAVLDIARRQQLPFQQLHNDRRLGSVESAGIATAIQLGEKRVCPLIVVVPQFLEQVRAE